MDKVLGRTAVPFKHAGASLTEFLLNDEINHLPHTPRRLIFVHLTSVNRAAQVNGFNTAQLSRASPLRRQTTLLSHKGVVALPTQ